MSTKTVLRILILAAMLAASFGLTPPALAQNSCGDRYTVARGDTLRKIANRCETTVDALLRANPEIKNPNRIYPGQVLVLPGAILEGNGSYDIYVVQRGDTLRKLASRFETTVNALLRLNPEIENANVIYEGQHLAIPTEIIPETGATEVYVVQRGDTLRKIADKFDTTVETLLKLNPQIKNANLIYRGQRLTVPTTASSYVVQRGDTLKEIANRFNTTVKALLQLNPAIKDPNIIYVGQVVRVR